MNCDICGTGCEGNLIIRDASVVQEIRACPGCFNEYANHDYDKLTKKLKARNDLKQKARKVARKRRSGQVSEDLEPLPSG
jgi:ribosome-binding protein aMBF1 (putative translation factor)